MKYIITENKLEQVIIHFLNKRYGDLTEYKIDEYPDSVFFVKDKKIYMEHELENDTLWIDYVTIWSDLENFFSLKDNEIKSVITKWVEEAYNIRGVTPGIRMGFSIAVVEEAYNIRGVTPFQTKWQTNF